MTGTVELTHDEAQALTKDLQEVLAKHNCEMSVASSIQLLKRVELPDEPINDTTEETPKAD